MSESQCSYIECSPARVTIAAVSLVVISVMASMTCYARTPNKALCSATAAGTVCACRVCNEGIETRHPSMISYACAQRWNREQPPYGSVPRCELFSLRAKQKSLSSVALWSSIAGLPTILLQLLWLGYCACTGTLHP